MTPRSTNEEPPTNGRDRVAAADGEGVNLSTPAAKGCTCGPCRAERRRKLNRDPVPDRPDPTTDQTDLEGFR